MDSRQKLDLQKLETHWLSGEVNEESIPKILVRFQSDDLVIHRIAEVLRIVGEASAIDWEKGFEDSLPFWFKKISPQPLTTNEMNVWLKKWRSLPPEEQQVWEEKKGWSLSDWLYWMSPDMRSWYVVNADRDSASSTLTLGVDSWPIPLGSALWLLKAAGASSIFVVE